MNDSYIPRPETLAQVTVLDARRRRMVLVALPQGDPLEFIGPVEVLNAANTILQIASARPDLGYDIEVAGVREGTIYAWNGMRLSADRTYREVTGAFDTLVLPALDWDESALADGAFVGWVADCAKRVRRVASVCTGSYLLAEAGLLEGRCATTHWAWAENFQERYPEVKVTPDPIYVKDGNVYTSAGGTSCMDLMLAFIEEDFGREIALRVAQFLVVYLKRPGGQAQFSVPLSSQMAERDAIRDLQQYIFEHLAGDLGVEALAERAHMSPRNFARVFAREAGVTPGRFVEQARVEGARRLLETTSRSVAQIAASCGFGTTETMRQAFVRHLGVSPREYRAKFAGAA